MVEAIAQTRIKQPINYPNMRDLEPAPESAPPNLPHHRHAQSPAYLPPEFLPAISVAAADNSPSTILSSRSWAGSGLRMYPYRPSRLAV